MFRRIAIALVAATVVGAVAPPAGAAPSVAACTDAREQAASLRDVKKLRDARDQLQICAAKACPAAVRTECSRRLAQVSGAIPAVVFDVKDADGHALRGVQVSMDGIVVSERLDGKPLELDPGAHTFLFTVTGGAPLTLSLTLREGEKNRHQAVVLLPAPSEPATPPPPPPPPPPVPAPPAPVAVVAVSPAPPERSTLQSVAVGSMAVGTAALIFGGVFGVVAISEWSAQQSDCRSLTSCSNHTLAVSDHSHVESDGTIATVGVVAGGLLAAGGLAMYFLGAPSSEHPSEPVTTGMVVLPGISPGGGGLSLSGAF